MSLIRQKTMLSFNASDGRRLFRNRRWFTIAYSCQLF